jgi:hypothetical protein
MFLNMLLIRFVICLFIYFAVTDIDCIFNFFVSYMDTVEPNFIKLKVFVPASDGFVFGLEKNVNFQENSGFLNLKSIIQISFPDPTTYGGFEDHGDGSITINIKVPVVEESVKETYSETDFFWQTILDGVLFFGSILIKVWKL